MTELLHNNKVIQTISDDWQTKARGTKSAEYQIYLAFADDGKGDDITRPGQPLKSFDEWATS